MNMAKNFLEYFVDGVLAVGGINWGLVGIFEFDLVKWLADFAGFAPSWIYLPVGIVAVYKVYDLIWG